MSNIRKYQWLPWSVLLLLYGILAGLYSLSTPLFEAPDEYYHFAVIHHIAATGERPPTDNAQEQPWRQMAFHAPLYHWIGAVLIRPIDSGDFLTGYPLNPHAQIGEPSARDNHNFIAHTGDPWQGAGLAARIVRGFSILLGGVTLGGVYWLARGVFQQRRTALLAMCVVLLNPQFLFSSGVINNDNLVIALSTVALALLAGLIRQGIKLPMLMVLAMVLAAASLAKASGLVLYPVVIIGLARVCWRDRIAVGRVLLYAVIGLLAFALIAGWWYLENWQQYGDPTASTQVALATGPRDRPLTLAELRGAYYSFWGMFGWFNIPAPPVFYGWTLLLLAVTAAGLIVRAARSWSRRREVTFIAALLALYALLVLASWWHFNTLVLAGQGRLWFPLLGVVGCAVAAGITAWRMRWLPALLLAPLALAAVALPLTRIAPVYRPAPQLPRVEWMPPDAVPVPLREPWQDDACAVLWIAPPRWNGEGQPVQVDLAWEARCAVSGYWSVFIHFSDLSRETCQVGDTGHIFAQVDSMPDGGNTPLPTLQPGYVLEDRMMITAPAGIDLARPWRLQVGLYDAGRTFIRAFVSENDHALGVVDGVQVGRCSPELVNVELRGLTVSPESVED
jgi:4-amino-4-deoxy-L-arabinose transferase-like glycosyltransferase